MVSFIIIPAISYRSCILYNVSFATYQTNSRIVNYGNLLKAYSSPG